MSDTDNQWYFDLATGVVSQGKAGNWTDRMGPYATEAEARDAPPPARGGRGGPRVLI